MGRINKTELQKRLAVVEQLLLDGKKSSLVVQFITQKYGVKERQAWHYIRKAWENIKAGYDKERDKWLGFHVSARMNLYRKAIDKKQIFVASNILKDLANLQGLYVNKHAFTDPAGEQDYGGITTDELVKRLIAVLQSGGKDAEELVKKLLMGKE